MQITEPVTMLTDYALGTVNLFFAIWIFTKMDSKNRVAGLLFGLGFLFEAVSAFVGGTFHGFAAHISPSNLRSLWNLILLTAGGALAFLASGIHSADVRRPNGRWIVSAIVIAVGSLVIQVTGFRAHQDFNHNDVFHVILLGAMCLFYKGARSLKDRAYSPR
jgi:hypothetical protein